jgi:hypothetical protein
MNEPLGGPRAPVPARLIDLIWSREIDPGKLFDLELPLCRPPMVTGRWMSGERSRSFSAHDPDVDDNRGSSEEEQLIAAMKSATERFAGKIALLCRSRPYPPLPIALPPHAMRLDPKGNRS